MTNATNEPAIAHDGHVAIVTLLALDSFAVLFCRSMYREYELHRLRCVIAFMRLVCCDARVLDGQRDWANLCQLSAVRVELQIVRLPISDEL
jgi:hypothetical protein